MATFLAICQEVSNIVGLQGTIQSVSTVSGYQATLIQHVKNAYEDIQSYRDEWDFLRDSVDIVLTQGATGSGVFSDVQRWDIRHIYYDSTPLSIVSHDWYIQTKQSEAAQGRPSIVAQDITTRRLYFNPVDAGYTIVAYYWKVPETLSANTDVPIIPISYHKLLIYRAAADFSAFIGNGNLYQTYNTKADTLMGKLLRDNNPAKRVTLRPAC